MEHQRFSFLAADKEAMWSKLHCCNKSELNAPSVMNVKRLGGIVGETKELKHCGTHCATIWKTKPNKALFEFGFTGFTVKSTLARRGTWLKSGESCGDMLITWLQHQLFASARS